MSNFVSEYGRMKFLTHVQREKVAKKNYSNDIDRIKVAVNFYNNDNTMYIV